MVSEVQSLSVLKNSEKLQRTLVLLQDYLLNTCFILYPGKDFWFLYSVQTKLTDLVNLLTCN